MILHDYTRPAPAASSARMAEPRLKNPTQVPQISAHKVSENLQQNRFGRVFIRFFNGRGRPSSMFETRSCDSL